MRYYFALIHRREPHRFSAEVPDLPCCIADGSSAEEALSNARKLAARRMAGLRQADMSPPESRSLNAAMAERAGCSVVKAVMIAAE